MTFKYRAVCLSTHLFIVCLSLGKVKYALIKDYFIYFLETFIKSFRLSLPRRKYYLITVQSSAGVSQ